MPVKLNKIPDSRLRGFRDDMANVVQKAKGPGGGSTGANQDRFSVA
jgi:hypothetical protein